MSVDTVCAVCAICTVGGSVKFMALGSDVVNCLGDILHVSLVHYKSSENSPSETQRQTYTQK